MSLSLYIYIYTNSNNNNNDNNELVCIHTIIYYHIVVTHVVKA